MDNQEYDITKDEDLWYKVGVDYEAVYDPKLTKEDNIKKLILSFTSTGKMNFLEKRIPKGKLEDEIIKKAIMGAHSEWLWSKNKSGEIYECPDKNVFDTTFSTKIDEGIVAEDIDEFKIIWTCQPRPVTELDDKQGRIIGRRLKNAESVILKLSEGKFEIRGRRELVKKIKNDKIEKDGKFKQKKVEIQKENIIKQIEELVFTPNDLFELVRIKFIETSLPHKSWLDLKNSQDLREDLRTLEKTEIIHPKSFSDVSEITLKSYSNGKLIKIKLQRLEDGFRLQLDDKNMTDEERKEIMNILANLYGSIFDKIHSYSPQYDVKFIFHKILDGSKTTYDKYFHLLPKNVRDVLEIFIEVKEIDEYTCENCGKKARKTKCDSCGSTKISHTKNKSIILKEKEIKKSIKDRLAIIGQSIDSEKISYDGIKFNEFDINFQRRVKAKNTNKSNFTKFTIIPISKEKIPNYVDEFLGNYGFVIYGNSSIHPSRFDSFGRIDLYDLMFEEKRLESLFLTMVEDSIIGLEKRLTILSMDAEQRIKTVDYTNFSKDFERDVFYILKSILPLSERWGRVGKRESDGITIFADENDNYFVGSYDPKFSLDDYNLDSEEQNKAVYYILDESSNENIKNIKKTDNIDSHIIILNKYNETKVQTFCQGVRQWFRLIEGFNEPIKNPIIILNSEQLVELHRIYCQNSGLIKGLPEFHIKFLEEIKNLFSTDQAHKIIRDEDIENLREMLLKKSRAIRYQEPLKLIN